LIETINKNINILQKTIKIYNNYKTRKVSLEDLVVVLDKDLEQNNTNQNKDHTKIMFFEYL